MRRALGLLLLLALVSPAFAAGERQPPYWASIASGKAMMRTGPGRNYPGTWLYVRRDLPVRVLKIYENWRLIQDPDGTRGWMLVSLLSDQRTAIVRPGEPRAIHEDARSISRTSYLAEPGVVLRVERCDGQWCRVESGKKRGWIAIQDLFGVSAGERID